MRSYLQKLVMILMLAVTFESSFGDKFMYQHARKAPDEMRELHKQFYAYMKKLKETRYEIL
jgi:2-dehydropantoate 2-reductase